MDYSLSTRDGLLDAESIAADSELMRLQYDKLKMKYGRLKQQVAGLSRNSYYGLLVLGAYGTWRHAVALLDANTGPVGRSELVPGFWSEF